MLLQPSNITPSTFAGEGYGTVAVADPVNITWQVNGNTPMTGFQITLYENSPTSFSPVWNSSIISTGSPFYGVDEKGNPIFYSYAPNNTTWADLGLTDGNEYKLTITQYWGGETDTDHAVNQYSENVFLTRTKPSLSLNVSNNTTVSSVTKTFTGSYSQAQNDSVSSVKWVLSYVSNGALVELQNTGEINTGMLSFTADGLLNGFSYNVSCTVITSSGVSVNASVYFSVEYEQEEISGLKIDGTWLADESLLLEWSDLKTQSASQSGSSVSISGNSLVLGDSSSVSWDLSKEPLNLDTNDGIYFRTVGTKPLVRTARNTIERGLCAAFSPSGTLLAVGDNSQTTIYSVSAQGVLTKESTISLSPYALSFSQDGSYLIAVGDFSGYISLYSVSGKTITPIVNGSTDIVHSLQCCCSLDSNRFFVGGNGGGYCVSASSSGITVLDSLSIGTASILSCAYGNTNIVFGTTDFLAKCSTDSGGKFSAVSIVSTGTAYNSIRFSSDGYLFCKRSVGGNIDSFDKSYKYISTNALSANSFSLVSSSTSGSYSYIVVSTNNSYGTPVIRVYEQSGASITLSTESEDADSFVSLETSSSGILCGVGGVSCTLYSVFTGIQSFSTILPGSPGLAIRQNGFYFEIVNNGTLSIKTRNAYNVADVLFAISGRARNGKVLVRFFDAEGNWLGFTSNEKNYDKSISLSTINNVKFEGPSTIRYLAIGSSFSDLNLGSFPVVNDNTKFMTEFSTNSGTTVNAKIRISGSEPAALYRLGENQSVLSPVAIPAFISSGKIKDYSLKSAYKYYYNLFFQEKNSGSTVYSLPVVSAPFCRQFRAYTLLEATEDPDYPSIYHVLHVWRFGCSLSVGKISNNNQPTYLENFTRYPIRQPSRQSPKSGTLTGLLGKVSSKGYRDTVEQMELLFEASHSLNAFFLKDMKGNLYRVSISAPIQQEININTREERVTVTIPWQEIGSAEGLDIIQLPTDPGWGKDEAEKITASTDPDTGILSVTYPQNYSGSTLFQKQDILYAETPNGMEPDTFALENGILKVSNP